MVSPQASKEMWEIFRQQHYNSMLIRSLPQYYVDPDNYDDNQIFSFASKSGSMNACRNDGGIVTTPYGSYVIVMLHKEFSDKQYYPEHPATVYGGRGEPADLRPVPGFGGQDQALTFVLVKAHLPMLYYIG